MNDEAARLAGPSVVATIRDGVLDTEIAALAWVLVDGRVPLLVTAPAEVAAAAEDLAAALADFVPPSIGRATLGPAEVEGDPARDTLVTGTLASGALRRAVRGVARGFGLVGCVGGGSLERLLARLADFTVGASPELVGRLGTVLVLGAEPPHRVVAAHYLRPVARDAGGHVQHLPPAVLATWDPGSERWDHFAWGIYPELASRLGRRAGDLERDHAERTEILAALVGAGGDDRAQLLATLAHARGHPGSQ